MPPPSNTSAASISPGPARFARQHRSSPAAIAVLAFWAAALCPAWSASQPYSSCPPIRKSPSGDRQAAAVSMGIPAVVYSSGSVANAVMPSVPIRAHTPTISPCAGRGSPPARLTGSGWACVCTSGACSALACGPSRTSSRTSPASARISNASRKKLPESP